MTENGIAAGWKPNKSSGDCSVPSACVQSKLGHHPNIALDIGKIQTAGAVLWKFLHRKPLHPHPRISGSQFLLGGAGQDTSWLQGRPLIPTPATKHNLPQQCQAQHCGVRVECLGLSWSVLMSMRREEPHIRKAAIAGAIAVSIRIEDEL